MRIAADTAALSDSTCPSIGIRINVSANPAISSDSPLPAGMVIENTDKGGLKRFSNRNCVLYKLDIEDKKYNKLDKVINKMMKNTKLRYNILGLLCCRLGFAFERQNHMFCSEFVCWVLAKSDIIYLEKSRSLYKPSDLMQIDGIEEAYKGTLFELDKFLKSKKEG